MSSLRFFALFCVACALTACAPKPAPEPLKAAVAAGDALRPVDEGNAAGWLNEAGGHSWRGRVDRYIGGAESKRAEDRRDGVGRATEVNADAAASSDPRCGEARGDARGQLVELAVADVAPARLDDRRARATVRDPAGVDGRQSTHP